MAIMTLKLLIITSLAMFATSFISTKLYMYLLNKGVGVPIFNHSPGKCRIIPGIECGSEDFAVTESGLTFISNGFRSVTGCDLNTLRGNIYLFDFKNPAANVTKLDIITTSIDMAEFEPHGLSLWKKDDGKIILFAVDHGVSERVQIFEYDERNPGKLFHKETIMDDKFVCINDLVAVGERQFYITNWLAYCKSGHMAWALESLFLLATGSIAYYDGNNARIEVSKLMMSNGINKSPGGKYIYMAACNSQSLSIFNRDIDNGSLTLHAEINLRTAPDNIEVDQDSGDLYIATHRNPNLAFKDYDGMLAAPSHVLRVRPTDSQWSDASVTEILSNDGTNFVRGSSVAHYYKGKLLVGSVFHKLAICEDVNIQ